MFSLSAPLMIAPGTPFGLLAVASGPADPTATLGPGIALPILGSFNQLSSSAEATARVSVNRAAGQQGVIVEFGGSTIGSAVVVGPEERLYFTAGTGSSGWASAPAPVGVFDVVISAAASAARVMLVIVQDGIVTTSPAHGISINASGTVAGADAGRVGDLQGSMRAAPSGLTFVRTFEGSITAATGWLAAIPEVLA